MAKLPKDDAATPTADTSPPPPGPIEAGGVDPVPPMLLAFAQQNTARPAEAAPPFAEAPRGGPPQYPTVEPQWPFYLVFDVNRWGVIAGRVCPLLYKLSGSPGANAVQRDSGGRTSMALAVADLAKSGRILIPHDVDGPGRSYLIPWQVGVSKNKKTGAVEPVFSWHTRWETLFVGSREIVTDLDGYAEWCGSLVTRGIIPGPASYIFERLESFYRTRIGQYRVKDPQRAEQYQVDLQSVIAAKQASGPRIPAQPAAHVDSGLV